MSADEILGLQAISIRLDRELIEEFKMLAALSGIGYQPLMRQALKEFSDKEKSRILEQAYSKAQARKSK